LYAVDFILNIIIQKKHCKNYGHIISDVSGLMQGIKNHYTYSQSPSYFYILFS